MAKAKYYYVVADKENGNPYDNGDGILLFSEKAPAKYYIKNVISYHTDKKHVVVKIVRSNIERLILASKLL